MEVEETEVPLCYRYLLFVEETTWWLVLYISLARYLLSHEEVPPWLAGMI